MPFEGLGFRVLLRIRLLKIDMIPETCKVIYILIHLNYLVKSIQTCLISAHYSKEKPQSYLDFGLMFCQTLSGFDASILGVNNRFVDQLMEMFD